MFTKDARAPGKRLGQTPRQRPIESVTCLQPPVNARFPRTPSALPARLVQRASNHGPPPHALQPRALLRCG
eukprot:5951197-Prymnesium_polylepis.1